MDIVTEAMSTAGKNLPAIIEVPNKTQELITMVAKSLGVNRQKSRELISRYGEENVSYALEIKQDKLTVSLACFVKIRQEFRLRPDQVQVIYLTRLKATEHAKNNFLHYSVTLRQLAMLAQKFEDFGNNDEESQFETVLNIVRSFGSGSLKSAVDRTMEIAERYNFNNLDELLEVTGDVSERFAEAYDRARTGEGYNPRAREER